MSICVLVLSCYVDSLPVMVVAAWWDDDAPVAFCWYCVQQQLVFSGFPTHYYWLFIIYGVALVAAVYFLLFQLYVVVIPILNSISAARSFPSAAILWSRHGVVAPCYDHAGGEAFAPYLKHAQLHARTQIVCKFSSRHRRC